MLIAGYAQEVSSRRKDRRNRTHVDHRSPVEGEFLRDNTVVVAACSYELLVYWNWDKSDDIFIFWITQLKTNRFEWFLESRILMTFYINVINLSTAPEKCHRTILWNADLFHVIEVRFALPSKKRWQYCNKIFSLLHIKDTLFAVSYIIRTLAACVHFFRVCSKCHRQLLTQAQRR